MSLRIHDSEEALDFDQVLLRHQGIELVVMKAVVVLCWLFRQVGAGYLRGSVASSLGEAHQNRRLAAQQRKGIPIPGNGPIKCQWVRFSRISCLEAVELFRFRSRLVHTTRLNAYPCCVFHLVTLSIHTC